jgi:VanZ family protein
LSGRPRGKALTLRRATGILVELQRFPVVEMAEEKRPQKRNRLKAWLPLVVWVVLIFVGSSIPLTNVQINVPEGSDKVVHALEYLILGVLFCRGFGVQRLGGKVSVWLLVVAICLAIAAIDEYHQRFIPGRDSSLYDFATDVAGIFAGASLGVWRLKPGADRPEET